MGRYLRRLALGVGGALTIFVFLVPLTSQAAVAPAGYASAPSHGRPGVSAAQAAVWQEADAEGASATATARALGAYLVRQPDGTLSLNAPVAVVNSLPSKYVGEVTAGLLALNTMVAVGELQTTAAGVVFDPKTDILTFQGGWTGHGRDWWHDWYCFNHNDVQTIVTSGWWMLGSGALGLLALLATSLAQIIGSVALIYGGWLAVDDRGNGSCLNFGHWAWPNVWVTSQ